MTVSKKDIPNLLDKLIAEYQVIAPVKKDDFAVFAPIASGADAELGAGNTKLPAKEIFFPQSETLFS